MARDRIVTSDPEDLTLVLGVRGSHISVLTLSNVFVHSSGTSDYRVWPAYDYLTKLQLNARTYLLF